jgi:hypothetical protein
LASAKKSALEMLIKSDFANMTEEQKKAQVVQVEVIDDFCCCCCCSSVSREPKILLFFGISPDFP